MKVYIYCTKAKPYLRLNQHNGIHYTYDTIPTDDDLNGKIVASFELNRIEIYENTRFNLSLWESYEEYELAKEIAYKETGLCFEELEKYAAGKDLYEWHIENLKILEESLELKDFYQRCKCYEDGQKPITKTPQSWQYAYRIIGWDKSEPCILISIKPEFVCKILNREKTIEIRKTYPKKEQLWR